MTTNDAKSPWMNTQQLADYLGKPSREAAWVWVRRRGIAAVRAGGTILVARRDVEAALRPVVYRSSVVKPVKRIA